VLLCIFISPVQKLIIVFRLSSLSINSYHDPYSRSPGPFFHPLAIIPMQNASSAASPAGGSNGHKWGAVSLLSLADLRSSDSMLTPPLLCHLNSLHYPICTKLISGSHRIPAHTPLRIPTSLAPMLGGMSLQDRCMLAARDMPISRAPDLRR